MRGKNPFVEQLLRLLDNVFFGFLPWLLRGAGKIILFVLQEAGRTLGRRLLNVVKFLVLLPFKLAIALIKFLAVYWRGTLQIVTLLVMIGGFVYSGYFLVTQVAGPAAQSSGNWLSANKTELIISLIFALVVLLWSLFTEDKKAPVSAMSVLGLWALLFALFLALVLLVEESWSEIVAVGKAFALAYTAEIVVFAITIFVTFTVLTEKIPWKLRLVVAVAIGGMAVYMAMKL